MLNLKDRDGKHEVTILMASNSPTPEERLFGGFIRCDECRFLGSFLCDWILHNEHSRVTRKVKFSIFSCTGRLYFVSEFKMVEFDIYNAVVTPCFLYKYGKKFQFEPSRFTHISGISHIPKK